ncbi:MAG: hypothetical protein ABJA82_02000 [Myxococcales bacterium]
MTGIADRLLGCLLAEQDSMTGYPLQSVLDLRRREEEAAMARLVNAARAREQAEQAEARLAAEVQAAGERLAQAVTSALPTGVAAGARDAALFVERRRQEANRAGVRLAEFRAGPLADSRRSEASAREAHLAARRARETFEKHAAKHAAAVRVAGERREEQRLDDLRRHDPTRAFRKNDSHGGD